MGALQARWVWAAGRFLPILREGARRAAQASALELFLDIANAASLAYQTLAIIYLAWMRLRNVALHPVYGWFFVVAVAYSTVHRVWLQGKFQKKKWVVEEERRSQAISVAIAQLGQCTRRGAMTALEADHIEAGVLEAMLSEVALVVADREGIYLNVTLIVEDREDTEFLRCLNRARRDRPLQARYQKRQEKMLPWEALRDAKTVYDPDVTHLSDKPYKSVLVLPILLPGHQIPAALGVVSIDSAKSHHFDGRVQRRIAQRLLSHVTLLGLVLVSRDRYNAWP